MVTAPRPLVPGDRIGPYTIETLLGTGGMAEVFAAVHSLTGVRFALKRGLVGGQSPQAIESAKREARIALEIRHPNIVRAHDFLFDDDGVPILVMELLRGLSCADLTPYTRQPGGVALTVAIVDGAARALDHLHSQKDPETGRIGLVHRDVSPDNLFVTIDGVVKLVDFGLAKQSDDHRLTSAGMIKGKLGFMSPEQVAGTRIDGRTDEFSLATTVYWMLTGRSPFARDTMAKTLDAVMRAEVAALAGGDVRITPALDQALLRAFHRRPEHRFQTCRDFADALRDACGVLPATTADLAQLVGLAAGNTGVRVLASLPSTEHHALASASEEPMTLSQHHAHLLASTPPPGAQAATAEPPPFATEATFSDLRKRQDDMAMWPTHEEHLASLSPQRPVVAPRNISGLSQALSTRSSTAPADAPTQRRAIPASASTNTQPTGASADPSPSQATWQEPLLKEVMPFPRLPFAEAPFPDRDPSGPVADGLPTRETVSDQTLVALPPTPETPKRSRAPMLAFAFAACAVFFTAGALAVLRPTLLPPSLATWLDLGAPPPTTTPTTTVAPTPPPLPQPNDNTPSAAAAATEQKIRLKAPAFITWQTTGGVELKRGSGEVTIDTRATSIVAKDTLRNSSITLPIGPVLDYSAVPRFPLSIRVRPWAEVFLGNERLGLTPFDAVPVVPGRYRVKLQYEEHTREIDVDVSDGPVEVRHRFDG